MRLDHAREFGAHRFYFSAVDRDARTASSARRINDLEYVASTCGDCRQPADICLACEARPYDIRVTALLPGATDTPIWDERPGFDRAQMMKPEDVAGFLVAILERPGIAVEEVVVTPPAGAL